MIRAGPLQSSRHPSLHQSGGLDCLPKSLYVRGDTCSLITAGEIYCFNLFKPLWRQDSKSTVQLGWDAGVLHWWYLKTNHSDIKKQPVDTFWVLFDPSYSTLLRIKGGVLFGGVDSFYCQLFWGDNPNIGIWIARGKFYTWGCSQSWTLTAMWGLGSIPLVEGELAWELSRDLRVGLGLWALRSILSLSSAK